MFYAVWLALLMLLFPSSEALGGDSDEHGCLGAAGFVWCESLGRCHRPWEVTCPSTCDTAAGESWCPGEQRCMKLWLEACPSLPGAGGPIGGKKDLHGCLGSAGYQWCETKQKCLRRWEEPCE